MLSLKVPLRLPARWLLRLRAALSALSLGFCRRRRRRFERRACEPRVDDGGPYVGWFDSSHDLLRGLAVTEHAEPEDNGLAIA